MKTENIDKVIAFCKEVMKKNLEDNDLDSSSYDDYDSGINFGEYYTAKHILELLDVLPSKE